jgi:uncharacterized protein YaiI (UPF0178 family)
MVVWVDAYGRTALSGEPTRGPAPLNKNDIQAFANKLDKFLTRHGSG